MKIKREHLQEFMEYMVGENPDVVDITTGEHGFTIDMEFIDLEGRSCTITLHEASINTPPDLNKKMKLKTRLPKKEKGRA